MDFLKVIKWLTYRSFVVRVARAFHIQNFLEKVYYKVMRPKGGKIRISVKEIEADFYVDRSDELRLVEVIGCSRGGEHRLLELLISLCQPGDIVYDIGASIGTHTIFLAKRLGEYGRVIAFEPEKQSYERLQSNIELNHLNNITVFQVALGEEEGEGVLHESEGLGTYSLMVPYNEAKENTESSVKIIRGDLLRKIENLPIPKVVKIDVEGYEYSVIQGLRETFSQNSCKVVCCEIHPKLLPKNIGFKEIATLMSSLGFTRIEINQRLGGFHAIWYKE